MTDSALEAVLARLQQLEDERAVLGTLYSYGHAIDYGDEDRWLSCFTEDAAFDVRRRLHPEDSARHDGREGLQRFISQHTRAPADWHKHLLMEPYVVLDGDQATCTSYFLRVDAHQGGDTRIVAMGRYRDVLVRSDDGQWRIRERVVEVEDR